MTLKQIIKEQKAENQDLLSRLRERDEKIQALDTKRQELEIKDKENTQILKKCGEELTKLNHKLGLSEKRIAKLFETFNNLVSFMNIQ